MTLPEVEVWGVKKLVDGEGAGDLTLRVEEDGTAPEVATLGVRVDVQGGVVIWYACVVCYTRRTVLYGVFFVW